LGGEIRKKEPDGSKKIIDPSGKPATKKETKTAKKKINSTKKKVFAPQIQIPTLAK